ncbi:MAG TPA: peptidylprolyl isomerase [Thermoanaerobaculia bacterium]|nr:peptidylprolyl isomerase [Thermoanaerobaculia bacterium]
MEDRRFYDPLLVGRASASPDPWLRAKTALACGRLKDSDAGPFLPVALDDEEPAVRRAAAFASGISGDARLVRFLVAALADTDAETAANAAEALGKIGGEEAITALLAAASGTAGPRTAAALALFRFPEERTLRALEPLVKGGAPPLRTAAVYALARKPRAEAAPLLRQALGGPPDVAPLAARGLGVLADAESVPALTVLTSHPEPSVAIESLLALEKIGAKTPLGPAARDAILARVSDPMPGIAVAALKALGRFGGDEDVAQRLAAAAARGGWRGQTALVSLARVRGASARAALVEALTAKPLEARLGAAEAIGALPAPEAGDLLALAFRDRAARVREVAIGSAPRAVLERHLDLLVAALADADPAVRSAALEASSPLLGSGAGASGLERAWRRAYDASFERSAEPDYTVGALDAAVARPDGGRALIEARVDDRDPVVREKARRLLVEKFHVAPRFVKIAVRTGRDLPEYRALARRANESRVAADVALARGGAFRIDLAAEDAPMTVESFASLARRGFFDGNVIHRVVPDFVVQAGDPRGDGTGGPGYTIRDEINPLRYHRSAVGMALSGPDTGGSQWFIALAPQPHLDGGYTVFGDVTRGMADVDGIEQDDVIARITIEERPRESRPPGSGP